jgi:hypothetical protein
MAAERDGFTAQPLRGASDCEELTTSLKRCRGYEPQIFPRPVTCTNTYRTCTTGCQAVGEVAADAAARKADLSVPRSGLTASDGRFEGKMEMRGDWQNLSIWVSESVILGVSRMMAQVTIPQKAAENAEFASRRTSDFRHLGLWPLECDSTSELVIQPKQSNGDEDN